MSFEAVRLADAFHYLTKNEVYAIRFFALIQPDNAVCVNIGAGTGTSALAFLEARPDLTYSFWTVDISMEHPHGGLANEQNAFRTAKMSTPNQILHDSNTVDYRVYMNKDNPQIDYLFIDADHSYEGCMADFDNAYPFLKKGSVVGFHDYGSPNWPDVRIAVKDIMEKTGARKLLHIDTIFGIML